MDIYNMTSCSRDMVDEYEKLIRRMNPPHVVVDNETSKKVTIVRMDSVNRPGILLEVVQVLADLNLIITKAYISSDGVWFMDVFHVTDQDGNKVFDQYILDYIQKTLGPDSGFDSSTRSVGLTRSEDHTAIELIGCDRPGLLSEISAVLTHLKCNVVSAEVWTHNTRAAAVVHVTDEETGSALSDLDRLSKVKELLSNVLRGRGRDKSTEARTTISNGATLSARRLHQMMFADREYDRNDPHDYEVVLGDEQRPNVEVVNCYAKDYSIVTIRSKDRPLLLFDTVCTLTDMQYVVYHANIDAEGPEANQEYYIRHTDGSPVKSDAERERLTRCIEAAIQRRVSEGLKLELCMKDRAGLLSDITRIFRENSLTVTRAQVTTKDGEALDTFYVKDASGSPVDSKRIDSIRQTIGNTVLMVKCDAKAASQRSSPTWSLFGGLFLSQSLVKLGFVRSYY